MNNGFWRQMIVFLPILFAYPMLIIHGTAFDLKLFTPATLAMLAMAVTLWTPKKLANAFACNGFFPALPIAAMALIGAIHFAFDGHWDFEALCACLVWLAFPVFSWTNAKECRNGIFLLLSLFWLINMLFLISAIATGGEADGIPGNRNWAATLSLMAAPFPIWFAWRLLPATRLGMALKIIATTLIAISTLWSLFPCDSRGAWLALGCAGTLFIFLEAKDKWRKILVAVGIAIAIAAVALAYTKFQDNIARVIADDVRLPLWESVISMLKEHTAIGVGQVNFESEFATFRSPEYFLNHNAAVRTNHPHNDLLFIWTGFGLPGLLAWLALLVYPIMLFMVSYRRRTIESKLVFFSLLAVLTHGMFDLVLYEWPTAMLGLLLLGLLWAETWPVLDAQEDKFDGERILCWTAKSAAAIIALAALASAGLCMASHMYSGRADEIKEKMDKAGAPLVAGYNNIASELHRTDPAVLYKTATHAYLHAKNTDLTLDALDRMDNTPWWNFAHANAFRAKCLLLKGRNTEAELYMLKEIANYPLQSLPLYSLLLLYRQTGQVEKEKIIIAALDGILKIRGLSEADFKAILANPDLDLHFERKADTQTIN